MNPPIDISSLSFDTQSMLQSLRAWIECESPTYDTLAVNRMMDLAMRDFAMQGASVERIPGTLGFGDCVRARFPHSDAGSPGILILCHLDTVHPVGTLSQLPWRIEGDKCYGPGILDMKGGSFIALHAMKALQKVTINTPLPITFLLTSDEEIGSPSTRALIESEAMQNKFVLVPEPARRDGGVVTGRYAIARYRLTATGRPSHAGLRLNEGVSAISEIAHQVGIVEGMTNDDCTFSVGVLRGGQWVNCVATTASIEILNMSKTEALLAEGRQRLAELTPRRPEVTLALEHGVCRPLWTTTKNDLAIYALAREIARDLGFEIPSQYSAGGSDGNFTGALGVPTLDGLGPCGEGPHTLDEHVVISSLAARGRLIAGLISRLS
jgi:glutamate carboxypeptidase